MKMEDCVAVGSHAGSLNGTVTLNIQIKNGINVCWLSKVCKMSCNLSSIFL